MRQWEQRVGGTEALNLHIDVHCDQSLFTARAILTNDRAFHTPIMLISIIYLNDKMIVYSYFEV